MLVVNVENLYVDYGKTHAVRGISLQIPKGEVYGFIGPNGAGKSSTIKVLATLLPGYRGRAHRQRDRRRAGPASRARAHRLHAGLLRRLRGSDDARVSSFFCRRVPHPPARRHQTVNDVLELTDLTHKIDAQVDSLSRGMKQRLALARVLLHDPDLLLLDEPASGLDPRARIEVRELLKELKNMGKTILISSHILHELGQLCTRIGIIEAGQMVAQGPLDEIYRRLQLMRIVHVQLAHDSDVLLGRLREIPGVDSVERQIDRIAIRLHEDQLSIEELHDAIHGLGGRIRMYQPEAMDIETAFMKLTQGTTA